MNNSDVAAREVLSQLTGLSADSSLDEFSKELIFGKRCVYLVGKYVGGLIKFVYATMVREKAIDVLNRNQNKYILWTVELDNKEEQK